MAESNRKCSRLGEWFVQEEIARAIDTALETIIGLSKRKQFKYHGGESLFALDFHTEKTHLFFSAAAPLLSVLEGRVDTGIASLSSKSSCVRRVISKWLLHACRECVPVQFFFFVLLFVFGHTQFPSLPGNLKFWRKRRTNRGNLFQSYKLHHVKYSFFLRENNIHPPPFLFGALLQKLR